jgi:hypothetical protein
MLPSAGRPLLFSPLLSSPLLFSSLLFLLPSSPVPPPASTRPPTGYDAAAQFGALIVQLQQSRRRPETSHLTTLHGLCGRRPKIARRGGAPLPAAPSMLSIMTRRPVQRRGRQVPVAQCQCQQQASVPRISDVKKASICIFVSGAASLASPRLVA